MMRVTPYGVADDRYAQKLDGPNYYIGGRFVELCGDEARYSSWSTTDSTQKLETGIDYCIYAFTCVAHAVSYERIRPKLSSVRMRAWSRWRRYRWS